MTSEEDVVIIKDLVKVRYHLKFTMHVCIRFRDFSRGIGYIEDRR